MYKSEVMVGIYDMLHHDFKEKTNNNSYKKFIILVKCLQQRVFLRDINPVVEGSIFVY